jgi:multimeric flavodoxin WrbA
MIEGIPVNDLFKATETEDLKLAILRHVRTFEDEDVAWATDQIVKRVREGFPEVAVSDNSLPNYRIISRASNDPESKDFRPDDQFPVLLDILQRADAIVIGCRSACGMPDSRLVRVIERLHAAMKAKRDNNKGGPDDHRPLFGPKALAVVAIGGAGACGASKAVAAAFNKFGCILAPKAAMGWDEGDGDDIYKDTDFQGCLSRLGDDLLKLAKAIK